MPNPPRPFLSKKNKTLFTNIIVIYSIFYIAMKLFAILFREAWADANLLLCLPFLVLGVWGGISSKQKTTSWFYVIVSVVVISAIRYYENELMIWLHAV